MTPDHDPYHSDITVRLALAFTISLTFLYIAPFYISPTLKTTPVNSRDSPNVIRARVKAVGGTGLISVLAAIYLFTVYGQDSPRDIIRLLGIAPVFFDDILKTLALVAILFVGPLYESLIVDGEWREFTPKNFKHNFYDSWVGYRNHVVAPISEEIIFRSLTISMFLSAETDPFRIVFMTPLIFGLAHIHHLVEFVRSKTPANRTMPPPNILFVGIIRSLFQFTYTSLFGFFAAFIFMRTANIWACIAAHSFCNYMGVPRFWGRVGQDDDHYSDVTPDVAQGKREDGARVSGHGGTAPKNLSIGWTVVYYALLLVGSYTFYQLLWPWTESDNGF